MSTDCHLAYWVVLNANEEARRLTIAEKDHSLLLSNLVCGKWCENDEWEGIRSNPWPHNGVIWQVSRQVGMQVCRRELIISKIANWPSMPFK